MADGAVEDVRDAEPATDIAGGLFGSAEPEAGRSADDHKAGALGEDVQDFVGDAFGDAARLRVIAQVVEGQDGEPDLARPASGRGGFLLGLAGNKPIAHAGDGLQREPAVGFRQAPQAGEAAVDGVLSHRAPGPAGFDQIVARDHLTTAARQGHQDLHDSRLQDLALGLGHHFTRRGSHLQGAQGRKPVSWARSMIIIAPRAVSNASRGRP